MKATFKDGGLMTPTPRTDKLHGSMCGAAGDEEYIVKMRWHAESLERETQSLHSRIANLEKQITKLEPERL